MRLALALAILLALAPAAVAAPQVEIRRTSHGMTNSNDSYWLSNPAQPLEGFDRIIGDERTERTLRTRSGLRIVGDRLAGGGRFSLRALRDAVFNNRQFAGELMRDDLVAYCRTQPDLAEACDVLAGWNLRDDLDARGAVLFRRFATRLLESGGGVATPPGIWRVPFDPADPVGTPRSLNTAHPLVAQALRGAMDDVRGLGKGLGVTLREVQFERRGDERIPIHGGPGDPEGVFNAINVEWVPGQGYPNVPHGSSFVMAANLLPNRCPESRSILTYSQSTNPQSRWFADQTRMFSRKEWVDMRFCEREILADPDLTITRFGKVRCTSRRAITYRLPLRRRERVRRVRATVNGKRVRAARGGRRGVRVSLRGRPKGRCRIRVVARTTRARTIRLERRARTCKPTRKRRSRSPSIPTTSAATSPRPPTARRSTPRSGCASRPPAARAATACAPSPPARRCRPSSSRPAASRGLTPVRFLTP